MCIPKMWENICIFSNKIFYIDLFTFFVDTDRKHECFEKLFNIDSAK